MKPGCDDSDALALHRLTEPDEQAETDGCNGLRDALAAHAESGLDSPARLL